MHGKPDFLQQQRWLRQPSVQPHDTILEHVLGIGGSDISFGTSASEIYVQSMVVTSGTSGLDLLACFQTIVVYDIVLHH